MILNLLDQLAGKWLEWRTERAIQTNPLYLEFGLQKVEVSENGMYEGTFVSPAAAILADEASKMLNAANAENYIQFDMMPRLDRGLRPIRVTVQWANGLAPAEKAARQEKRIAELEKEIQGRDAWIEYLCDRGNNIFADLGRYTNTLLHIAFDDHSLPEVRKIAENALKVPLKEAYIEFKRSEK